MEQKDAFKDTFTGWRRSYLRLRILERNLVSEARSGKDPVKIAAMHAKVEAMRAATSALFQLAQTASMVHQIPSLRGGDISVW